LKGEVGMWKRIGVLLAVLAFGVIASCGGGNYSPETSDRFMNECLQVWDDPFCGCALDYFESSGDETWFKSTTWNSPQRINFSDPAAWLIGVPGFALIECQEEFQG
jgi:hypothetical protein